MLLVLMLDSGRTPRPSTGVKGPWGPPIKGVEIMNLLTNTEREQLLANGRAQREHIRRGDDSLDFMSMDGRYVDERQESKATRPVVKFFMSMDGRYFAGRQDAGSDHARRWRDLAPHRTRSRGFGYCLRPLRPRSRLSRTRLRSAFRDRIHCCVCFTVLLRSLSSRHILVSSLARSALTLCQCGDSSALAP